MDGVVPAGYRDVIERLSQLATQQGLLGRAREGCAQWFINEPEDIPYTLDVVRMEFDFQSLVFKSALSGRPIYPYIATQLRLYVGDDEIGYYRLITLLDGTDDDDYFVLT